MNLKQFNINEIPGRSRWYKPGRLQNILFQFMESGMDCAEIELDQEEAGRPEAAQRVSASLRLAIKRENLSCLCLYRKGRVFLIRNKE